VILHRFLIALMAGMICVGCSMKPVPDDVRPFRVSWERVRDVAILKFDGPYGETVRLHTQKRLVEVKHFNLIEALQSGPLAEVSCDRLEEAQFLHTLETLATDTVIGGHVTAILNDNHGTDQAQVKEGTGYYKKEKDVHGQWVDVEIQRTVQRALPYVTRQASLTTSFKIFDLNTRRFIATDELTESYEKKFGGVNEPHDLGDLPSPDVTLDELAARTAVRLVAKLSRMKLSSIISFDKDDNSMVMRGVTLAEDGAWEDAMQLWNDVIQNEPDNPSALYNLGVAYESLGDIENLRIAKGLYQKAATCGDKTLYADGISRVKDMIQQDNNHWN